MIMSPSHGRSLRVYRAMCRCASETTQKGLPTTIPSVPFGGGAQLRDRVGLESLGIGGGIFHVPVLVFKHD